jgi:hypothetical protein
MRITIWTHWEGKQWTGDAPISRFQSTEEKLDAIFRFFNRVHEADHQRMAEVGYLLPSLSVGDRIELADGWYEVASLGFQRCDPPPAS